VRCSGCVPSKRNCSSPKCGRALDDAELRLRGLVLRDLDQQIERREQDVALRLRRCVAEQVLDDDLEDRVVVVVLAVDDLVQELDHRHMDRQLRVEQERRDPRHVRRPEQTPLDTHDDEEAVEQPRDRGRAEPREEVQQRAKPPLSRNDASSDSAMSGCARKSTRWTRSARSGSAQRRTARAQARGPPS
jgi:predicted phage gp36 major capsid-like protein